MPQWFRFYNEALDDPKVQKLPGDTFKAWVNLLCLAARGDGTLPPHADIAFALRVSDAKATALLDTLVEAGLLDHNETGIKPHNWNGRQFKNDVSTDRVKRFRQRRETVSETASETPPDTDSDTDTDTEQKGKKGVPPNKPSVEIEIVEADANRPDDAEAVWAWNDLAAELRLPAIQRLTPARSAALRARLGECGGIEGWKAALAKVRASPFLRGESGRSNGHENWRCTFDWLIRQSSFTKLLEGAYDSAPGNGGKGSLARAMRDLVEQTEEPVQ